MSLQLSHKIVFVLGPTASGKSALALELAKIKNGAVVNCDSLQVFKGLDIGTAKPSAFERASLPHFLFDFVSLGQNFTAGDYRRSALEVIERELPKRDLFFVGGSGFYIQALDKGMNEVLPVAPETIKALDEAEKQHGLLHLWHQLEQLDAESAKKIHPNDGYRIKRALSVIQTSGEKWSAQQAMAKEGQHLSSRFTVKKIGLKWDREVLHKRVAERTENMLEAGLIEEVQALVQKGFGSWAPLQSVGYKETLGFLKGELGRNELAPAITQSTMQLAKKQMTWFKRDPEIQWFDGSLTHDEIISEISL